MSVLSGDKSFNQCFRYNKLGEGEQTRFACPLHYRNSVLTSEAFSYHPSTSEDRDNEMSITIAGYNRIEAIYEGA